MSTLKRFDDLLRHQLQPPFSEDDDEENHRNVSISHLVTNPRTVATAYPQL